MDLIDNLWNLLLLIFWYGIWNGGQRSAVFNPYVARIDSMTGKVADFMRPAFTFLPARMTMAILFLLLLFLRGALFHGLATARDIEWGLTFGIARSISCREVLDCVAFSFLSFFIFLFRFWTLHLMYYHRSLAVHPAETIECIAAPFPAIRREFRPFALLFVAMVVVAALDLAGLKPVDYVGAGSIPVVLRNPDSVPFAILTRVLLVALAGCVQILPMLSLAVIVLIVAFWIGLLTKKQELFKIASDWSQFFLYPLRSRINLVIGTLDLVPVIFILLTSFVFSLMVTLIYAAILQIP